MIVSHNELEASVNKAFLSTRKSYGEADVIATMVSQLQIVNLNGIRHFNNAFEFIKSEKDMLFKIEVMEPNFIKINLYGSSLAYHIPIIVDHILERLSKNNYLKIEIINCHNRWLIYSQLIYLASKGFQCVANWSNGSSPKSVLCFVNSFFPDIYLSEEQVELEDNVHDITLRIAKQDLDIDPILLKRYKTYISSENLKSRYLLSKNKGIFVEDSDWVLLRKNAALVLVENSEKSSLGAGERQRKVS